MNLKDFVRTLENGTGIEKEKVLKEFKVEVTETLSRTVLVEAYDECEAIDQVEEIYYDEEIILDADDFAGVNFEIIEEE